MAYTTATTTEDRDTFDDRFSWTRTMYERHGEQLVERLWPDADRVHVEAHDSELARQLDFAGIDLIVSLETGRQIRAGLRFRTNKRGFERELSLRGRRAGSDPDRLSEREKLEQAWRDRTLPIDRFLFGVGIGYDRQMCLERGFAQLSVVHVPRLCEALHDDEIAVEQHGKGDGSSATYIALGELKRVDAITSQCTIDDRERWWHLAQPITVPVAVGGHE